MIESGMNIRIRTKEEWEVFVEVGTKEGITWSGGGSLTTSISYYERSIQVGMWEPNTITWCDLNYKCRECPNIVEASDLFRNQLISRKIKEGKHA